MRAQATNTVRRARRIILCLWTAGIIYCSPWLILSTTMPKQLDDGRSITACTFTLARGKYRVYYMADLIIFYAVPLLTATVLYGLIARTLCRAASGPAPTDARSSTRLTGDSSGVGGEAPRNVRVRLSMFRRTGVGVGGAHRRRSTFLRQQSSISMSSANASNARIQVNNDDDDNDNARYFFEPIAVETLGVFNASSRVLLDDLRRRITSSSGEARETSGSQC